MKSKLSAESLESIDKRLQRLEGQVRGVRRMLNDDRDCCDILTQLSAIRGAAHQISLLLFENYALDCVSSSDDSEPADEVIARMVNILGRIAWTVTPLCRDLCQQRAF